ncbi:MAG: MarR family winged helix-turn-helix transcriptional regulator [Armatimonadota bacterium]
MSDDLISAQAAEITSLLSGLNRRLSTPGENDPTAELPLAQLRVCNMLRDNPRTMSSLSRELGISLSAITQITDRLERADLVERVPEEEDRRVKLLQLTAHGEVVMRKRREARICRMRQALQQLTPQVRCEVVKAFELLLDAGTATDPRLAGDVILVEE